jgi:hypothetical protein
MTGKTGISFYKAFADFERALRDFDSVLLYSEKNRTADPIFHGPGVDRVNVTIRTYPVTDRIQILRERHSYVESQRTAPLSHPSPGFRSEVIQTQHIADYYCLMSGDSFITNKDRALFIIKRYTGVKLPDIRPPIKSNLEKHIVIDVSPRSRPHPWRIL